MILHLQSGLVCMCSCTETCALCVGQAGADAAKAGPGSKQAGVMLQRSKWTAQVGLVLHSQVPSPLAGYALPPGICSTLSE